MTRLRVAVIGTGQKKVQPDLNGYAMAYQHAAGYLALTDLCELVACADLVRGNAEAFAAATGIARDGIYTDYHAMLEDCRPDVVSICTWPHLHAAMAIDCAVAGARAVHCEKPMADSWGAARLMAQECARRNVQLTFNHQLRFGVPFLRASALLRDGIIGDLVRLEVGCDGDIFDVGTHFFDLCGLYAGDEPAEWVIGQIDYRTEQRAFGAHAENQALASWRYPGGVYGLIAAGEGRPIIGAALRLIGAAGTIEIGVTDGPLLRLRRRESPGWEVVDTGDATLYGPGYYEAAIADTIEALRRGRDPKLGARYALNATELIFAIYESSRRHSRVDLPLTVDDNALAAMVSSGDLHPAPASVPLGDVAQ